MQLIEQIKQSRYHGSLILYCDKEITSSNGLAKQIFLDRKRILTGKMNLDFRKRIVKSLAWSVALYAAETWTMSNTDVKRIEAFKIWF